MNVILKKKKQKRKITLKKILKKKKENRKENLEDLSNLETPEENLGDLVGGASGKITNNYVKNNIDWFRVCIGLDEFDATFEYNVLKEIIDMGIYIKKEEILENLKKLENNTDFRLIIKKTLFDCAKNPRTFFDRLFGSISFLHLKHVILIKDKVFFIYMMNTVDF